ncbi:hypothetical protein CHCC14527_1253 [Bacillus paralicheniformis]|nr:hypothetical protein CHCC14527_1253 [Bacillus paralicheniformis]TWN60601.1 hypothetical protein CHCC14427_3770 [Bacillus paralicheniformis]
MTALRSRQLSPSLFGLLGRFNRPVYIRNRRFLHKPDDIPCICRVQALFHPARFSLHPAAVDKVKIRFIFSCNRHLQIPPFVYRAAVVFG